MDVSIIALLGVFYGQDRVGDTGRCSAQDHRGDDIAGDTDIEAGLAFVIRAWTDDQIDSATGWPLEDIAAYQEHEFNAMEGGVTLNYTFPLSIVPDDGLSVRITAEVLSDDPPWDRALLAIMPDSGYYEFMPGDWNEDVNFTISLGSDDTGTR